MNDAVLDHFRGLADDLSKRPTERIKIELRSGTVLNAKYDPLFDTISLGGMTFPAKEVDRWTMVGWMSKVKKIVKVLDLPVAAE